MARQKTFRAPEEIANGILSSVDAVRNVVAAIADGRLPAPEIKLGEAELRFAPNFRREMPSDSPGVPYTLNDVAAYISALSGKDCTADVGGGRRAANRWVRVAMLLLEGIECGYVDEQFTFDNIRASRVGYRVQPLLAELRIRREAHQVIAGAEIEADHNPFAAVYV